MLLDKWIILTLVSSKRISPLKTFFALQFPSQPLKHDVMAGDSRLQNK
jgi:hypothetical protein